MVVQRNLNYNLPNGRKEKAMEILGHERNDELKREYNSLKAANRRCRYGEQDCSTCKHIKTCSMGQFIAEMSR